MWSIFLIQFNYVVYSLAEVVQYLIAFAIFFTFGLQFYIPMDILWRKIGDKIPVRMHNVAQISIRTGIILIMGAVSMAVPDLEPFIGLVGAVFFSILGKIIVFYCFIYGLQYIIYLYSGLLFPVIVETVFLWPHTGRFHWILIKNVVLGTASICALVAGSWVSISDIIDIYSGDSEH